MVFKRMFAFVVPRSFVLGLLVLMASIPAFAEERLEVLPFRPVAMSDAGIIAGVFREEGRDRPIVYDVLVRDNRYLPLPEGATGGWPIAMNRTGHIYGAVWMGQSHGICWERNLQSFFPAFRLKEVFGAGNSAFLGGNALDARLVRVGAERLFSNVQWSVNEESLSLPLPSIPLRAMNERRMACGGAWVLDDAGTLHDLRTTFPGERVDAVALNEAGQVLVNRVLSNPTRWEIALWQAGKVTPVPVGPEAVGVALNDAGWVLGTQGGKAFLWRPDTGFRDLYEKLAGITAPATIPIALNNAGWMVFRTRQSGENRGVLLRPIP